jgi:hypothetical protein
MNKIKLTPFTTDDVFETIIAQQFAQKKVNARNPEINAIGSLRKDALPPQQTQPKSRKNI